MSYNNTSIKLYPAAIKKITDAQIRALEMTAEALHTEVVQAQVMPRDTGHLQNESTFVDTSQSKLGTVSLVSSTPYARRLYFHPEYNFSKVENPKAGGAWYKTWTEGEQKDFCEKKYAEFLKKSL